MARVHVPFVDWMKCLGMALIVFGHVVVSPLNDLTPPIYPKQLGVAFFMFVSGYTLAIDRRAVWRVVLNRLFEIVLVGLLCAAVISAVRLSQGLRPAPSNYLPFMLGANVFFDNFPANPTTWYIGTYIHLVLIWAAFLRHVQVGPALLVAAVAIEIAVRAVLWKTAGAYLTYMLLTNWLAVFLLGQYCGQRVSAERAWRPSRAWSGLAVLPVVWIVVVLSRFRFDQDFPFRAADLGVAWQVVALTAVGVSALGVGMPWLAYRITDRLPHVPLVRFIAANTVVIFVTHMPVFYMLQPTLRHIGRAEQSAVLFVICLIGLALVGEILRRLVRPIELRERIARWLALA